MTPQANPLSQYVLSNRETWADGDIILMGPQGDGKSFTAATASAQFPEKLGTPAKLDDMLWISVDSGATAGLIADGIEVPHEINVARALRDELAANKLFAAIPKMATELKAKHPTLRWAVVDTVSTLDKALITYLEMMQGEDGDKRALFGRVSALHNQFYYAMRRVGLRLIWIFHAKAMLEQVLGNNASNAARTTVKNEEIKRDAAGLANIELDVTGQAKVLYGGNANLKFLVKALPTPKGSKETPRYLYIDRSENWGTKNRFERLVADREECHLGRLEQRIAAHIAKQTASAATPGEAQEQAAGTKEQST